MKSLRQRRWKDFRSRADYSPASVYRHRASGWEYIPTHPFADETELLSQLNVSPEECTSVDAWWGIDEDATLLEVHCTSSPTGLDAPGLSAHGTMHDTRWIYLGATLNVPCITRPVFEAVMTRFVELGFPLAEEFQLPAGSRLVLLADE